MAETKTKAFAGIDQRLIVRPIMRMRNPLVSDPDHEAYFLFGSSTIEYTLPRDRQNNLLDPFIHEGDREWLESELDMDLNYHKRKDNEWDRLKVRLGKSIRRLNLNNPKDYLDYLILRANKLFITPEDGSVKKQATHRYEIISEEVENKKAADTADLEIEAYMHLGKLKGDTESMVNFLKVYGKKVSPVSKPDFLLKEIKAIIQKDLTGFLAVMENQEDYELKLLISRAVECKAVIKTGRKYSLPGGDPLCGPESVPVIDTVVEYLKNPANQDILSAITARVNNAKD